MTALCTITTGGTAGWDPTTGAGTGTAPTRLYDARACRVQDLTRAARPADAAGQPVGAFPYLVAIEDDAADIPKGARVHIDACTDDPRLAGKTLVVAVTAYASLRFERDLFCNLDPQNQEVV